MKLQVLGSSTLIWNKWRANNLGSTKCNCHAEIYHTYDLYLLFSCRLWTCNFKLATLSCTIYEKKRSGFRLSNHEKPRKSFLTSILYTREGNELIPWQYFLKSRRNKGILGIRYASPGELKMANSSWCARTIRPVSTTRLELSKVYGGTCSHMISKQIKTSSRIKYLDITGTVNW